MLWNHCHARCWPGPGTRTLWIRWPPGPWLTQERFYRQTGVRKKASFVPLESRKEFRVGVSLWKTGKVSIKENTGQLESELSIWPISSCDFMCFQGWGVVSKLSGAKLWRHVLVGKGALLLWLPWPPQGFPAINSFPFIMPRGGGSGEQMWTWAPTSSLQLLGSFPSFLLSCLSCFQNYLGRENSQVLLNPRSLSHIHTSFRESAVDSAAVSIPELALLQLLPYHLSIANIHSFIQLTSPPRSSP